MKFIIILSSVLLFTGCASSCKEACVAGFGPGNSLFDLYANYADSQDPCQLKGKPEGYQFPGFCGASRGKTVTVQKVSNTRYLISK